jgi:hypothetical protein
VRGLEASVGGRVRLAGEVDDGAFEGGRDVGDHVPVGAQLAAFDP